MRWATEKSHQTNLDRVPLPRQFPVMLTRKHIEFGAKIYIVALIIVFTIYLVDVLQMMGILDA